MSDTIIEVLGYEESITVPELFSQIHPQDLPYFVDFENNIIEFFKLKTLPHRSKKYSPKEHEMLYFICKVNRVQIGELLGISKHRRSSMKKNKTTSIARLVAKTMSERWI